MKRKYSIIILVVILVIWHNGFLRAEFSDSEVKRAFKEADDSRELVKFLNWRKRLQEKIRDTERKKVNFSIAEYYFKINDIKDAKQAFQEYVNQGPVGITTLLANVYLYKLAKLADNETETGAIKKELFQDQFILLFDKYKTLKDKSLGDNTYEVHYFVDRIEVFCNGEIFEQISP